MASTRTPDAVGDYPGVHVEYFDDRHTYTVNGNRVPSVTTVLGVLDKPLQGWVERITLEGVWELLRRYGNPYERPLPAHCPWHSGKYVPFYAKECQVPLKDCPRNPGLCQLHKNLKRKRLDAYAVKKRAADRGVDVHQVWQDWNEERKIPALDRYPEDRHPYIRAMLDFIIEHNPTGVEVEMVVGSAEHGYAGRLDTVVVVADEAGTSMIDIKTSKAVYPGSHFPQLRGYEIARRECGLKPTDRQGILRLGADGTYELRWSDAEDEDFLSIVRTFYSQKKWK